MNIKFVLILTLYFISNNISAQKFKITSPDNSIKVIIENGGVLQYSVLVNEHFILQKSDIGIEINGKTYLKNGVIKSNKIKKVDESLTAVIPLKSSKVRNNYNELILEYENSINVIFRAYDNGVAYRIESYLSDKITVDNELVNFNFAGNYNTYFPEEKSFISHYERQYKNLELDLISPNQFCSLPAIIDCKNGIKIGITESGLSDYPNLFLAGNSNNSLKGLFPKYVLEAIPGKAADRKEIITKEAKYIATTNGTRTFPWRILMISKNDAELIENQMVYLLSEENVLDKTDWIKPGKVAWDWWNANNIYGVDFKSGINTKTYKYYIDFASEYGLDYIILDEGWTKTTTNILESNDSMDVKELIKYGQKKNIGVILWVLWKPLYNHLEEALDLYNMWGAKGIKVDFMQRADQWMVNYYEMVLMEAAKRELLVDYHGAFKPAGLARKYPNYISNEGLQGLENVKWSEEITPDHDCTLPFTRMLAGFMDYTPGAMINAQKENFKVLYERPMSMGTRAHQIALYVIYESPLQMLADNPSNYIANESSTKFISQIPTVWDNTIAIDGKIGDYVIIARQNGDSWFLGAITDWTAREFEINLDFLDYGEYELLSANDGINADRYASDIKFRKEKVKKNDVIKIKMEKGGGYAAILKPIK